MKHLKELNLNEDIDYNINESDTSLLLAFDDEIKDELRKIYRKTKYSDKLDIIEHNIDNLLSVHKRWLELARNKYDARDIAEKLFKADMNVKK